MENTTQLFLAVRFNCNKCHDHPFERWTQDQYYQTAAYFAQVGLKADPASKGQTDRRHGRRGGQAALRGSSPTRPRARSIHDRTKTGRRRRSSRSRRRTRPPRTPRAAQELAAWITSKDNPYFARSYVNRLWGYLFGVGIIEPLDDIRAGNPPTNPELLDYLTAEFVKSGFDVRHVMRLICKSRTYQLSVATNKWNAGRQDQLLARDRPPAAGRGAATTRSTA